MLNKNTFEPALNLLQVNKMLLYLRKLEQRETAERFSFIINLIRIQIKTILSNKMFPISSIIPSTELMRNSKYPFFLCA